MSEDAPTYEAAGQPVAEQPRQGRGPTRPAVIAADLIESIEKAGADGAADFRTACIMDRTAKEGIAQARAAKRALRLHIAEEERRIARLERVADWLATAEKLTPTVRAFVVESIKPLSEQVQTIAPPAPDDDGQEDPAA